MENRIKGIEEDVRRLMASSLAQGLALQALLPHCPNAPQVLADLRSYAERTLQQSDDEPFPQAFQDEFLSEIDALSEALRRGQ